MHAACMHAASAACSCFSMHTLAAHDHAQGSCWMATGCSKGLATTRQLTRRACLPACCHLGDQGSRSDRRRHRRRRGRAPQERCRPGRRQKPARQPEPAIAGCSLCRGTFSAWGKPNWGRGSNAKCLGAVPGKQEAVKPCFVWSHNEGKAVTRPAETRYRADDCHPSPQAWARHAWLSGTRFPPPSSPARCCGCEDSGQKGGRRRRAALRPACSHGGSGGGGAAAVAAPRIIWAALPHSTCDVVVRSSNMWPAVACRQVEPEWSHC